MADNFRQIYEEQKLIIDEKLTRALDGRLPLSLYKPVDYILVSPAKRLRPILVLFSAAATGGKFENVYNAALAVEMLHNFTLIHDDIMDNADTRRGLETLHKIYDVNTAILAGDALMAVAYEYLLKDVKKEHLSVPYLFTRGLIEVCEGQSLDKDFELRDTVTIDEYLEMISKKTAALSRTCCSIGGVLGNGTEKEIEALTEFGMKLGLAFQIQDDLLDISGSEEFGKKIGGDLLEGKKTFLFIKALERAEGEDKEEFLRVVKNKGCREDEIGKFRDLYEKLGVLTEARDEVGKISSEAIDSLRHLSNLEYAGYLGDLANALIKRSK